MFRVFGNEGREGGKEGRREGGKEGRREGRGIGAKELDTCLSREGHEMHSWSRTLAAWLPK